MKKYKKLSVIVILSCAQFIGCSAVVKPDNPRPNIILIINDSLRASNLGCYGYQKDNISPNIDKLADEGIVFTNVISQAGYTLPSIASILTSKLPFDHGAYTQYQKLRNEENTLAEILKKSGYETAAFVGCGYTSKIYGLDQGFDIYEEADGGSIEEVNKMAFAWLKRNKGKPFFLMLHHYSTHDPYAPPVPYNQLYADIDYKGAYKNMFLDYKCLKRINKGVLRVDQSDIEYIISQYDGDVSNCDKHLGKLFNILKDLNLYSNSIIMIIADHGEDLMEHGTFSHGNVFDEVIHIPFIFHYPDMPFEHRTIDSNIAAVDIFPTVLDILEINIQENKNIEGISLLPLISGKRVTDERLIFSLGLDIKKNMRISLRSQNFKAVFTLDKRSWFVSPSELKIDRIELYNLKADPDELIDYSYAEPEMCLNFKRRLLDYLSRIETSSSDKKAVMDKETKERLRSLGYL